jgi:hypothetical protein
MISQFVSTIAEVKEDIDDLKDLPLKHAVNDVQPNIFDMTRSTAIDKTNTAIRTIVEDPEFQPLEKPLLAPIPEKHRVNIPVSEKTLD